MTDSIRKTSPLSLNELQGIPDRQRRALLRAGLGLSVGLSLIHI